MRFRPGGEGCPPMEEGLLCQLASLPRRCVDQPNRVGWEMFGHIASYITSHPSCGSRGRRVCGRWTNPCGWGQAELFDLATASRKHNRAPPERQVHLKTPCSTFRAPHRKCRPRHTSIFPLALRDPCSGCFAAAPTSSRSGRPGGRNLFDRILLMRQPVQREWSIYILPA
jgi:hypothetical protein